MLYSPLWLIWLLASDHGGRVSVLFREVVTRRPRYLDESRLVDTITSYRQRFSDYPRPWPPVIGALSRSPFDCISGTSYRLCAKANRSSLGRTMTREKQQVPNHVEGSPASFVELAQFVSEEAGRLLASFARQSVRFAPKLMPTSSPRGDVSV